MSVSSLEKKKILDIHVSLCRRAGDSYWTKCMPGLCQFNSVPDKPGYLFDPLCPWRPGSNIGKQFRRRLAFRIHRSFINASAGVSSGRLHCVIPCIMGLWLDGSIIIVYEGHCTWRVPPAFTDCINRSPVGSWRCIRTCSSLSLSHTSSTWLVYI